MYRLILALALILAAGSGCAESEAPPIPTGDPFEVRQLPGAVRDDAGTAVEGNNRFAVALYGELAGAEEGNLFFSPFSMSTAFAMCFAGARGNTETQMADVFRFGLDQATLPAAYEALLASLETGAGFDGYRLHLANRLWGQVGETFLDEYLALTRDRYGAEMERIDFAADPETARRRVNDWVANRTEQKIKGLMPPGTIDATTVLVLANAIYFKGTWATLFDEAETGNAPFHAPDGDITAPLMHREDDAALHARLGNLQVLELPYQGEDLSLFAFLPSARDGLAALEAGLTWEALDGWMAGVHEDGIHVYLPRFEVSSHFSMVRMLQALGMIDAFDGRADFSGMNGVAHDLFIGSAMHKAYVKLDEEGTEAAAATGIAMNRGGPPEFRADHPFLFLIRDNVTGAVLFMGRVTDPTVPAES